MFNRSLSLGADVPPALPSPPAAEGDGVNPRSRVSGTVGAELLLLLDVKGSAATLGAVVATVAAGASVAAVGATVAVSDAPGLAVGPAVGGNSASTTTGAAVTGVKGVTEAGVGGTGEGAVVKETMGAVVGGTAGAAVGEGVESSGVGGVGGAVEAGGREGEEGREVDGAVGGALRTVCGSLCSSVGVGESIPEGGYVDDWVSGVVVAAAVPGVGGRETGCAVGGAIAATAVAAGAGVAG